MLKTGYNIVCTSWENDADNYNTKMVTVDSYDVACFYVEWLRLFKSRHDEYQISNVADSYGNKSYLITETRRLAEKYNYRFYAIQKDKWDTMSDDDFVEACSERASDFTAGSEWYGFRVVETVTVYFSDHDIEPVDLNC